MVNQDFIKKYELKVSKTGLKVPVVNDVHLHSIYDPEREAAIFIEAQREIIAKKNEFLVLGLGFGYHVSELVKTLRDSKKPFRIVVIEPNIKVAEDCLAESIVNTNDVYVAYGKTAQEFYSNKDLIHFLLKKPAVINHAASFNLYTDYFRELLSFEADQSLESCSQQTDFDELKDYFSKLDSTMSLWDNIKTISEENTLCSDLDFLMLAFKNMTEKSNALTEERK